MMVRRPVFRPGRRITTTVLAGLVTSASVNGKPPASPPTTGTMSIPSARTTTAYSYRRSRLTRMDIGAGVSLTFFKGSFSTRPVNSTAPLSGRGIFHINGHATLLPTRYLGVRPTHHNRLLLCVTQGEREITGVLVQLLGCVIGIYIPDSIIVWKTFLSTSSSATGSSAVEENATTGPVKDTPSTGATSAAGTGDLSLASTGLSAAATGILGV
eukprot:IDg21711t1